MAKTSSKSDSSVSIALLPRPNVGTTGARADRHAGHVPAVLYGHGSDPLAVSVESRALEELMNSGKRNQLIDASVDGRSDTVLLRDVQRDPVSRRVIHADFQRVSKSEKIYATLRVVTVGVSPGVKDSGGVLDLVTHELEIAGPADQVPDHLEVDVSRLGLHAHVTAGDVKLPPGFTMYTPAHTIVVSVESSRTEKEAEATPAEQAAAVPTVGETQAPAAQS